MNAIEIAKRFLNYKRGETVQSPSGAELDALCEAVVEAEIYFQQIEIPEIRRIVLNETIAKRWLTKHAGDK